ncbi:MAG: diguanylate cyclase [Rubrobacteraceae bacterium]|nr:diguanylate cyclase [Rubrobacteraceae bacterium]
MDAVISDRAMPGGVDGLELCRRVRAREGDGGGYAYFVFLTALGEKEHLLEGIQAGADHYLTKPLDLDELQVCLISAARVTALHKQLNEQKRLLHEQARKDPLTGLGNRRALHEDLEVLAARARRYGHGYCTALYDVDHFKAYNDRHGHLAGDEVLRGVAHVLAERSRGGDACYRYGGEEFLIVMPEQTLESAWAAVDLVRRAVEDLRLPVGPGEPPGVVTVSAGIAALGPGEHKRVDALLGEADAALYRAKEVGRNRVVARAAESEPPCGAP